jgi:acyl-CoA thioesterase
MDFDRLIAPVASGPGRFAIDVPDGWQQGRGAFGGLVLAMLVRAAETAVEPGRVLRALNAEIVGPAQPGPSEISIEVLRAGTGVSTISARLVQAGEIQAHAVASFGKNRGTFRAPPVLAPPVAPPWRAIEPASIGPGAAVFAQHVEMRIVEGIPFTRPPLAPTVGWVRLRRPGPTRDGALVVAMMDCWYPALLVSLAAPRPIATLTFAFERISDLAGLDPDAPLLYRGTNLAGEEGYAIEQRELWGEDGRLVALNQQTIVVIK